MKKQIRALILALLFAITLLPAAVFAAGSDSVTPAFTRADGYWGEGGAASNTSFVVELYEGANKIASASLNNVGGIIDGDVYVTWSIPFAGSTDEYWTVEWAEGYPKYDMNPDAVKLVSDGSVVATNGVQYNAPDNLNPIVALAEGNTGGVVAYTSLADAMGNFQGRKVNVVRNVTEKIDGFYGATLTTNLPGGVTVTSTNTEDWIDFDDMTVSAGVTVNIANVYSGDSESVIEGVLNVGETYYHGYDAKTTVRNGGKITVGDSTILRYNENADSGIYIYGDGDDSTVEYDCNYYIGAYSGTFYAENANIETGYFLLKPSYDTEKETDTTKYPPMDVTLDNSSLTVVGTTDGQDSFIIDDQATLTLKNGSAIQDVRDFNILSGAKPGLNVDSTSAIKATNVSVADNVPLDFEKNSDGSVEFVIGGLYGAGTEADPYLINNLEELIWFRDKVDELASDGTTQFAGKYFKLTNDIDLTGINWNPIGSMSGDHGSFKGVFDGNGKTISNLNVQTTGNGLGLFARTAGNAEIKNLTLNNVTVKSTDNSNYVGGLVGNSYASTKISNVHVTGTIDISGRGYIGGISGHGYVVMDNVSVKGEGTISSTFWCAGGILGYGGEGATNITNAVVEGTGSGLTITSAAGGLGAIVGMAEDNNGTQPISGSNLSAENVTIKTYTGAYGDAYANYALGYLYGGNPTSKLTGTLTVEDVTLETSSGVEPAVNDAVATVGDTIYFDLQSAINAAEAGETITLMRNVTISETVTIPAGKTVTLDLNGKIIDGTEKVRIALASYGNLTLKDSSEAQTGAIKAGIGTAGNTVNICGGTFTMESGSVYSKNNAILIDEQAAQVTIQGGTITADPATRNSAVMYISSTSDTTVTITGGEMVGYNGILLWNNTTIEMTGGSIDARGSLGIQGNGSKDNTEISISGDAEITGYYAAIYHPQGGKLTIADNAKLSGWTGVVHKGGELVISGGTIAGTGAADDYAPVSSGFQDTGDGLYTEQYDNSTSSDHYGPTKVTITGGTFTSVNGYAVASYANPNNDVTRSEGFISAGTFIGAKPMDEALLVDGVVLNQDGTVKTPAYAGPAMNTVKVNPCTNGTVKAGPISASAGSTVTLYTKADAGYKLAGITVLDRSGALVPVTDGKFVMPEGGVTVTATFAAEDQAAHPFTDLAGYEYFEPAITYCYQNGLMIGTSAATFGPAETLSRAQVVTVLHRLAGTPAAPAHAFSDVPAGEYYTAAVSWAAETGITIGYGDGKFGPEDSITVEQLVAFLHRWEQLKNGGITETSLEAAMTWAAAEGLFGDMTVTGSADAARCQTALVLMNYLK